MSEGPPLFTYPLREGGREGLGMEGGAGDGGE